mmetsp:Transcript_36788/g.77193  ORF Transcript_36788/g.77193 Transcript_36788/m.77193 type:complete len:208 (+) Transcript_36788:1021-1644(+)
MLVIVRTFLDEVMRQGFARLGLEIRSLHIGGGINLAGLGTIVGVGHVIIVIIVVIGDSGLARLGVHVSLAGLGVHVALTGLSVNIALTGLGVHIPLDRLGILARVRHVVIVISHDRCLGGFGIGGSLPGLAAAGGMLVIGGMHVVDMSRFSGLGFGWCWFFDLGIGCCCFASLAFARNSRVCCSCVIVVSHYILHLTCFGIGNTLTL